MQVLNMESSDDALQEEKITKESKSPPKRRKKKNRKRGKHGSKEKISSPKMDKAEMKVPEKQNESQTLSSVERSRKPRSRSNSAKRIRNFFRRSAEPNDTKARNPEVNATSEFSFTSPDDEGDSDRHGQTQDRVEIYDPILKPRARLRQMTVKDAMQERKYKRSPSRHDEYRVPLGNSELCSSLPDLTDQISSQNTNTLSKRKHQKRSKSSDATLRRREKNKSLRPENEKDNSTKNLYESDIDALKETAITDDSVETLTEFPTTDFITDAFRKSDLHTQQLNKNNEAATHLHSSVSTIEQDERESRNTRESRESLENIQSFIDSESKRRESFSKFLLLSKTMPSYSTSSIARARSRDQSPCNSNESQSRDRSPYISNRISLNAINEGITVGNTPSSQQRKSRTLETSFIADIPFVDDNTGLTGSISPGKSENISKWLETTKHLDQTKPTKEEEKIEKHIVSDEDTFPDKQEYGCKEEKTKTTDLKPTEGKLTRDRNRKLSRSEYKSPRRFSGRSTSGDRKSKSRRRFSEQYKDLETREVLMPSAIPSMKKRSMSLYAAVSSQEEQTKDAIPDSDEKISSLTKMIDSDIDKGKQIEITNEQTPSGQVDGSNIIEDKGKIENDTNDQCNTMHELQTSRSVQTSVQNLQELLAQQIDKRVQPLHPHIEISEIDPRLSFSYEPIEFDHKSSLLPRQPSDRPEDNADRAGSDVEEVASFLTPDSSPLPSKKLKGALSKPSENKQKSETPNMASSDISRDNSKKSSTVDDAIEEFYDARDDVAIQPKPKGKLSIMTIVALKRKLARQRKKKTDATKGQEEEKVKDKGQEQADNIKAKQAKSKVETETKILLENETNKTISKASKLQESDIIEKILGADEEIIPLAKKKITFGSDDEPIASDEPIEDAILHERQKSERHVRRRESKIRERQRKALNCCKKFIAFLFSHIGLSSLVVAYSILGGIIFQALEGNNEIKMRSDVMGKRQQCIDDIYKLATELQLSKRDSEEFREEVKKLLYDFQGEVYEATAKKGWKNEEEMDPKNLNVEMQWSFASSLLFAITVMTTIGYGHVAPKTVYGRLVTIMYAIFGIPLTLLCLTNIGDLMATGFRLLYGKVCCGICCLLFRPSRKRLPDPEKGLLGSGGEVIVQSKEKSSPEVIHVPTIVCILLMTSYIMLGTLLFCIWEGWDVVTGSYFSFITLSTIGFGDVVPGMATADWAVKEKLVLCALYLVFGLSLIAMCFNLVQEDVKAKFRSLGSKMGLFDKNKR